MNPANLSTPDLIGSFLGFGFTLLVFSYVFGDNALFRVAIHIFIGVASGFAVVMAWYNVIWPQLLLPLFTGSQGERLFLVVPVLLSGLLLFKATPRLSRLGNLPVALLVGVGVATAIGGAVLGTVFPQAGASVNLFDLQASRQAGSNLWLSLVKGSLILVGTLTTLIYFHFGVRETPGQPGRRPEWMESLAWIGQIFIAITLGVLFAGVYAAALTALVERIHFLGDFIFPLVTR
jgi:hypothetical protein